MPVTPAAALAGRLALPLLAACPVALAGGSAAAQTAPVQLPEVLVQSTRDGGALTVPDTARARVLIERTPGAVTIVPDSAYRDTPALTVKDMFDYTAGVFAQPKWGEDARLSIRGSGLSRNFHLRGITLYQDGIPVNTADGSGDFQEIDPTAFRYVEVYKTANALRYGAATLGGAINFVTPTGRDADLVSLRADAGSFGFWRMQGSSGAAIGAFDYFVAGSVLRQDGFRDHSAGSSQRLRSNFGWRISPNVETRFYVDLNRIRQEIPGAVSRTAALTTPRLAAATNLVNDYERNIDSVRVASKTTIRLDGTMLEFGAFAINKRLLHPIFQFIDNHYRDFGGFVRAVDERTLFGRDNRFTAGVNVYVGKTDAARFVNVGGAKGALAFNAVERSTNTTVYAENAFYAWPDLALVAGTQYVFASRNRKDIFLADGDQSGRKSYSYWSPKIGVLWNVDPGWQVFANLSRSVEIPGFSELNFALVPLANLRPQTATTLEIGTRGRREEYSWDLALYRAWIRNEFQFFDLGGGNYQVANAGRTIHQGVEAALGVSLYAGIFEGGGKPDRLWLNLAYTLNDFRFASDAVWGNNKLPGAPNHFVRAELLYKHPSGAYAGPNIEWVPEAYFVDNANTLTTRSYALVGFKAGYDNGRNVSAFVELRNIANTKYIASASVAGIATANQALFEPGTGRAVYAGAKLRW